MCNSLLLIFIRIQLLFLIFYIVSIFNKRYSISSILLCRIDKQSTNRSIYFWNYLWLKIGITLLMLEIWSLMLFDKTAMNKKDKRVIDIWLTVEIYSLKLKALFIFVHWFHVSNCLFEIKNLKSTSYYLWHCLLAIFSFKTYNLKYFVVELSKKITF